MRAYLDGFADFAIPMADCKVIAIRGAPKAGESREASFSVLDRMRPKTALISCSQNREVADFEFTFPASLAT